MLLMAVAVMVVMVMMAMAMAEPHVMVTRINGRRIIHRSGRDDHQGRAHRHTRDRYAQRWRRGHDDCGDWNSDVYAERYAGARRVGARGSEGDCDCTDSKYLFHTYPFDGLFTAIFIALNSMESIVNQSLALGRRASE